MLKAFARQGAGRPLSAKHQTTSSSVRLICTTPRPFVRNQLESIPRRRFVRPRIESQIRSYTLYQKFKDRWGWDEAKKDIWRKHPILVPSLIGFIIVTIGTGVYIVYDHFTNVEPRFAKYPKPVSDSLRRAIYYTEIDLQPMKALSWYKHSLSVADNLEMHPFSDEVLGIRFQIAAMLEKAGLIKTAIDVLEKARADCEEWVTTGRRRKLIRDRERAVGKQDDMQGAAGSEETNGDNNMAQDTELNEDKLRDEVMKKVQGTWLKLAELYSRDHVRDMEKTENALIQAVDVGRTELQRRIDLKLPVSREEGSRFVNRTHVATAYNELADFYAKGGKNNLASSLYMQALALIKQEEPDSATCAQVSLLNNISSQMAEQAQARELPKQAPGTPPLSHDQLLQAASEWAKKALDVAAQIKPPNRDAECDQSCLTATYNLGEIAEMQENYTEARMFYQSAKKLATDLQSGEGVERANEALKRLKDAK